MKISELNESVKFNFNNGLIVYLDKKNKTFRFISDEEAKKLEKKGLTFTINTKDDYKKLTRKYKIDTNFDEFIKMSNEAKKRNKNVEFRKALAAMQRDVMRMIRKEKK